MKSSYLWTFGPHLQWENRIRTAHSFLARKKCFNAQITYCLLILGCQSHKSVKQLDFLRQKLKHCSNENILETIILAWWAAHMVALLIIHGNIAARYCRNNDKSILRDPTIHDRVEHFGYSKKSWYSPYFSSLLLLLPAQLLQVRAQDRKPGLQILRLRELPLIVAHAVLAWNEDDIGRINLRHILRIVSRAAGHNPVGKTELAAKLLTCGADIKGKWRSIRNHIDASRRNGFFT